MFLLGQIAAAIVAPRTNWDPAPRFVEAGTALTVAYIAVEILALPQAGKRWLIAGALGARSTGSISPCFCGPANSMRSMC
jgi:hypothetical protein